MAQKQTTFTFCAAGRGITSNPRRTMSAAPTLLLRGGIWRDAYSVLGPVRKVLPVKTGQSPFPICKHHPDDLVAEGRMIMCRRMEHL